MLSAAPYNSTLMHGQQYQSTGQNLTYRVMISLSNSFLFMPQLLEFPSIVFKNEQHKVKPWSMVCFDYKFNWRRGLVVLVQFNSVNEQ